MTRLVLFELFVTSLLLFEHHQQKLLVSWQFSGPYGVTKYGSGWRKDVVNQCLEFGASARFRWVSRLRTIRTARSVLWRNWHLCLTKWSCGDEVSEGSGVFWWRLLLTSEWHLNNKSIRKAQNLVHRDYSKRAHTHTHTHTHARTHAHTHTHTHTDYTANIDLDERRQ